MISFLLLQSTLGLAFLLLVRRGPCGALFALGLTLPLGGIAPDIGFALPWSAILVVATHVRWCLLGGGATQLQPEEGAGQSLSRSLVTGQLVLGVVAAYAVVLTLIVSMAPGTLFGIQDAVAAGWAPPQAEFRHLVQLARFLIALLAVPTVISLARRSAPKYLLQGFTVGSLASFAVGGYQSIAQSYGLPYLSPSSFGGMFGDALGLRETIIPIEIAGIPFARVYGFGGEPKHTGALALVLLVLLAYFGPRALGRFSRHFNAILWVTIAAIILTFSTGAWVGLALVLCILTVGGLGSSSRPISLPLVGSVLGGLLLLATNSRATIEARILNRLGQGADAALYYEWKDAALFRYWTDNPLTMLFGHSPGGVDFALIDYSDKVVSATTITPAYIGTRTVADIGLLGFALLGLSLALMFLSARDSRGRPAILAMVAVTPVLSGVALIAVLAAAAVIAVDREGVRAGGRQDIASQAVG